MSASIINSPGGISLASLSTTASTYPTANAILGVRVSSYGQQSNGSMESQKQYGRRAIKQYPNIKLRAIVYGVESGKLSAKRPLLEREISIARRLQDASGVPSIIVKRDLSRFIRPESYHRQRNNRVEPSIEEIEELLDRADGVILVTVEDPWLTESQRHSRATRNGKRKPGRKPRFDPDIMKWILRESRRGISTRSIARSLGMKSDSSVRRALESPQP